MHHPTPLPTTLSEAKRLGAKRYFTGRPCPHGHRVARLTSNRTVYGLQPAAIARLAHETPRGRRTDGRET